MIYYLEVEMYTTQFEELQERNSHYSNLYSTLRDSKIAGTKWLEGKIEYYKNKYEKLKDLSIEQMIKNKEIEYSFIIRKIVNFEYATSFRVPKNDYECRKLQPAYTEYHCNYKGEEQYWLLEYKNIMTEKGYEFIRYLGDQLNSAGLEFKVGDFVVLKEAPVGTIFVVKEVPEKHNPKKFFVNEYRLSTFEDGILKEHKYCGGQLQKYEGEINENSPLIELSKKYKEKIKLQDQ